MSHDLRFERVFDAAPEEVFDALTDPQGLEEMYGRDEPGWIVESSEGEVRVGCTWSVSFGPSREELYRFAQTYEVVDRPRRIAFASEQRAPDESILEADVEITLEERDGKTVLTLVERGYPSAEERDLHEVGTPHAYDRLERYIRTRAGRMAKGQDRRST